MKLEQAKMLLNDTQYREVKVSDIEYYRAWFSDGVMIAKSWRNGGTGRVAILILEGSSFEGEEAYELMECGILLSTQRATADDVESGRTLLQKAFAPFSRAIKHNVFEQEK